VRSPLRPVLILLVALGTALGACSGDGELGGPALGGTLAASVGSFQYSASDLEDEVEQWASNPAFLSQVLQITDPGQPGRRSADLVAFVLSHRIISEQGRQLAGDYEPSDEEIDALIAQIDQAFADPATQESAFRGYSEEFRRQLGVDFSYQQNLSAVDPESVTVPEVAVNPRFGAFQDQDRGLGQVVTPDGPVQPLTPAP
jgi:hypothetical protein